MRAAYAERIEQGFTFHDTENTKRAFFAVSKLSRPGRPNAGALWRQVARPPRAAPPLARSLNTADALTTA